MPYDPNDPSNDPNNPNQNGQAVSGDTASQTLAQQAASLTAAIKAGTVTPAQAQASLPSNTKIVNGVVVPNDPSMLPLFIMAAAVTAPFAVQGLTSLLSGGGAAGTAGAEGDAAGLADGANVAADTTGTGAVTGTLPSTQIGTGAITGAPSSVPSGAMSAATSAGVPDWLTSASQIGQALGAAGSGAAAGRNADNTANINYANAQNTLYKTELGAPGQIAGNAVRGDILSNARDVSLAAPSDIPVPTISGGLRPSMFSPTTRALGSSITANAAATPMPIATPPVLQPMETAGLGSDILNTAGVVGSLAKPVGNLLTQIPWGKIFG